MIGLADSIQFDSPRKKQEIVDTLSMATLNYSGLSSSPYEFYENQNQHERLISQTFASYVQEKHPEFGDGAGDKFKWTMSSLELKWENRFAPAKRIDVGIKQDDTMMSQEQFLAEWQRIYEQNKQQIRKTYFQERYKPEDIEKQEKQQIQSCKQYDLFCYKTLMKVYYGIDNLKGIKGVSAQPYRQIKSKQFSKPYLNEEIKLNTSIEEIKEMDHQIIFFQQSHKNFIARLKKQIEDYYIIQKPGIESIILINKSFCKEGINFQQENNKFLQEYSKKLEVQRNEIITPKQLLARLNFNKDSIFQVVGNYILINVHLSSKKDKNSTQMKQFKSQISRLLLLFPNHHLVSGGDFNCSIYNKLFQNLEQKGIKLSIAPQGFGSLSVNKKRTMMQAQRNKANILDQSTKDYFVSSLKLVQWNVTLINGTRIVKEVSSPLLPTTEHPYDHYIILATYQKPK